MRRTHGHRLRAALLAGLALLTAAAMTQPAWPAAAASSTTLTPERWVPVALGTHRFGHLRAPDAIVATADPDQVGFWSPPGGEGESYGPDSFDVARDGSIWLVDRKFNGGRLLVWPPGQPSAPARTVTLPFGIGDFAVAPDGGTIYVTYGDKETPAPGLDYHLGLAALSPTGQLRWKGPTIMDAMNAQLRFGPDGALYWAQVGAGPWTQLVTRSGRLLTIAQQRQRTHPGTLVSGGLRLVTEMVTPDGMTSHEWRVALVNQAGRVVRAWRITSQNNLEALMATPALVGGDPALALQIRQQAISKTKEYLVLRLAPNGGTRLRFALDAHAAWGDSPKITELRVGPDGQLYQLRSNPASGVRIARYSLASKAPKPGPPTTVTPGSGPVPPSTLTPPPPSHAPTPTVTPPTTPPVVHTAPASRSVLPWVAAIAAPALLAAMIGGWWWYRRRHPTGPRRHGRPHPAH